MTGQIKCTGTSAFSHGDPLRLSEKIADCALLYCSLPLLVFLLGFLRWYFALASAAALILALGRHLRGRQSTGARDIPELNKRQLLLLALAALAWTYLGGMNGFFYQSSDWGYRNAVFRDLIRYEWPVIYPENGSALVYYIGFWLPPALLAKAALFLSSSLETAFLVGRMALWLWSSLGVWFMMTLFCTRLCVYSGRTIFFAMLLLVFFSGMDVVGVLLSGRTKELFSYEIMHLEGWHKYQFTSITACLFWVFNQSIIPWILTLFFLMEDNCAGYMLFTATGLINGPFPAVGLSAFMVVKAGMLLWEAVHKKTVETFAWEIVSVPNLLSTVFIIPPVGFYLCANNAVQSRGSFLPDSVVQHELPQDLTSKIGALLLFLLLEAGIYMLLIWPDHRHDPLFYAMLAVFTVSPCIHVGSSNDFCMRATIPAVMILCIYCGEFLSNHLTQGKNQPKRKTKQLLAIALLAGLLLGACTPMMEFVRGIDHVIQEKSFCLEDLSVDTLDKPDIVDNFCGLEINCSTFFRYFTRNNE